MRNLTLDAPGAQSGVELNKPELLQQFFEAQADRAPNSDALECSSTTLTYRELEQRANKLAHFLIQLGVGPGQLVALYFDKTPRLFVSLLAVLKAGAGYVPIDPKFPNERVGYILSDASVSLLLTERALAKLGDSFLGGKTICIDEQARRIAKQSDERPLLAVARVTPRDLAYVIYTSGTTGHPKGVMIEHRSVATYLRAIAEVYRITSSDRVYQGFSIAFDASVEEIWGTWSAGATLIVGGVDVIHSPPLTARFLTSKGVTLFSTVPTFLAMIDNQLPTVRTLIIGGEPCQPELVSRWARGGRRMFNTYGPTEATVVATFWRCQSGAPVTIGQPLPGYYVFVLDENMKPVRRGMDGELYIGGEAVARGYVNLPERNATAFIDNPFRESACAAPRLFRTRDHVRISEAGELEFLGRLDDQIKIRGFRVEISEIESVLLEHDAVHATAVNLLEHGGGELAAYVVAEDGVSSIDRTDIANLLRARLPDYMVPKYLDVIESLPVSPSGKVCRLSLPTPKVLLAGDRRDVVKPANDTERQVAQVWQDILGTSVISVEDEFFLDLGGHSLLAALTASALRCEMAGVNISVQDIYEHPTVRQLAKHIETLRRTGDFESGGSIDGRQASKAVFERLSPWTRWTCIVLQAVSLYLYYSVMTAPVVAGFIVFIQAYQGVITLDQALYAGTVLAFAAWPCLLLVSIAVKWMVIGRYQPGRYPVWSFYYLRWWIVRLFQVLSWSNMFAGTPLMSLYYRAMGSTIGRNATIDTAGCAIFDLVAIGDNTSIGSETHILGYRIEDGMLCIDRIEIGKRCFVGTQCVLGLGTKMGDGARLDDLSLLPDGGEMKSGEGRRGSPATASPVIVPNPQPTAKGRRRPVQFGLVHLVVIYAVGYFLALTALPGVALVFFAFMYGGIGWAIAATFAAMPLGVVWFCACMIAVNRLILGRQRPGVYPIESGEYLRKWTMDFLLSNMRELMLPLYATLYFPPLLRMLGAEIGARVEISTVVSVSPDLIIMGEESFFADGAVVGGRRTYCGHVEISENRIGRRTFIGNSAVVPGGTHVGDNCLIGVLSVPPNPPRPVPDGTRWLGSPSFQLPRTQQDADFGDTTTYLPTRSLYIQRLVMDAVRILLPGAITATILVGLAYALVWAHTSLGPLWFLPVAPVIFFATAMSSVFMVAAAKVLLIGTFKPTVQPLWSMYVWINEVINGAYEGVAAPALKALMGTPFIEPFLRLFGCRIGRWVYLETTLFSEFDLVRIDDFAALNAGATIQTHLFEDRIMKSSYLHIGEECSVGNMAVILYDTELRRGATLGPLSLLMKGETLPAFTSWCGIPTQPARQAHARRLTATDSAASASAEDRGSAC